MNEKQAQLIEMFHSTSSLLRVCREDQSVMIEQHKLGTLLEDRIHESARRMDTALDVFPHMVAVLEALDDEPVPDGQAEAEAEAAHERRVHGEPEPEPAPEPELRAPDSEQAGYVGEPEADEQPTYRTGTEKRAAQAAAAAKEAEEDDSGDVED